MTSGWYDLLFSRMGTLWLALNDIRPFIVIPFYGFTAMLALRVVSVVFRLVDGVRQNMKD